MTTNFSGEFRNVSDSYIGNSFNAEGAIHIHNYLTRGHRDENKDVKVNSEEGQKVLDWLSKHKYHNRWRDHLASHLEGTGDWFLQTMQYRSWKNGQTKTFFCKAIPGTGKSTLMAHAARTIQDVRFANGVTKQALAVVFFSRSEDKNVREVDLMAAIARQVVEASEEISNTALQIFRTYQTNPSHCLDMRDIQTILLAELKRHNNVYLVIDALDECPSQPRLELLKRLSDLQRAHLQIRILMSSREIGVITEDITQNFGEVLTMKLSANKKDLQVFIEAQFRTRTHLRYAREYDGFIENLTLKLIRKAEGMFLLVVLHLQLLEAGKPETKRDFLDSLAELKDGFKSLRETYISIWKQIREQGDKEVERAQNVFMWVSYAKDLLSIQELQHALAAQRPSTLAIYEDDLYNQGLLIEPCLGLIVIGEDGLVDFMHPTAREILPEYLYGILPQAQNQICRACLTYLSLTALGHCTTSEQIEQCLDQFPLLSYAATTWAWHASKAEDGSKSRELLKWLSVAENVGRAARIAIFLCPDHTVYIPSYPMNVVPLHLAAFFGLLDVVAILLSHGDKPDVPDSNGWTAVRWAAWHNHPKVIKLLILGKADIDLKDGQGDTTLMWRLNERRPIKEAPITHKVLSSGNIRMHIGSTYDFRISAVHPNWILPLASRCSDEVLRILILHSRDIDTTNIYGRTALMQAADNRQFKYVDEMLSRGANIDRRDLKGMTALLWALQSWDERYEVSDMTLNGTASVHIGDHIIVDAPKDTTFTEPDFNDETANTINRLISRHSIEAKDHHGRSALALAAYSAQDRVVDKLLRLGAEVDSLDNYGLTPLLAACKRPPRRQLCTGRLNIVERAKVSIGIFFEFRGDKSHSYFHEVLERSYNKRVKIVTSMLAQSVPKRWVDGNGQTALELAEAANLPDIAKLLSSRCPPHMPENDMLLKPSEPIWDPSQHTYDQVSFDDYGHCYCYDGDVVLGARCHTVSRLLVTQLFSATLDVGKSTMRDRAMLVRGNLYGNEEYNLDSYWTYFGRVD